MRKSHALIATLAVTAACLAPISWSAPAAYADPPGSCPMGSATAPGSADLLLATQNLTLSVDGVAQAPTATAGIYGTGSEQYAVNLCRDSQNTNTYLVSVQQETQMGPMSLTANDANRTFTISFTPEATDTPLTLEGHAKVQRFSIDSANANRVAVTAKTIGYSDIYGNDCNNLAPFNCIAYIDQNGGGLASADLPRNLSFAVRYSLPSGQGAAGFTDLPGMYTSNGAMLFFVWASCPTNANRDQSYSGLKIDLGGPHLTQVGSPNIGSVSAFLPAAAVASCFGASPQVYAQNAQITRTENGTTQTASTASQADAGLQYQIAATDAGVTIAVPAVTFSQPTYKFSTRSQHSLARKVLTVSSLAKSLKISAPSRGKILATVAISSKKVCIAGKSSIYAFAKGTCSYTLSRYDSHGHRLSGSKSGTVRIS